MKMERKFKFGLFSSFLARLRSNRPSLAVLACLKREAKFQKFQKFKSFAAQLREHLKWSWVERERQIPSSFRELTHDR